MKIRIKTNTDLWRVQLTVIGNCHGENLQQHDRKEEHDRQDRFFQRPGSDARPKEELSMGGFAKVQCRYMLSTRNKDCGRHRREHRRIQLQVHQHQIRKQTLWQRVCCIREMEEQCCQVLESFGQNISYTTTIERKARNVREPIA